MMQDLFGGFSLIIGLGIFILAVIYVLSPLIIISQLSNIGKKLDIIINIMREKKE